MNEWMMVDDKVVPMMSFCATLNLYPGRAMKRILRLFDPCGQQMVVLETVVDLNLNEGIILERKGE